MITRKDWQRILPGMSADERLAATAIGKERWRYWKGRPSHYMPTNKVLTEIQGAGGELISRRGTGQPYPGFWPMVRSGRGPDHLHYNVKTISRDWHHLFVHPGSEESQSFTHYLGILLLDDGDVAYVLGEIAKGEAYARAYIKDDLPQPCLSLKWTRLDPYAGPPVIQAAPFTLEELRRPR